MKKVILAIGLIVLLTVASLGGLVYANNSHQPMIGDKLVGYADLGSWDGLKSYSWFTITNPDCVNDITVERISITREDGSLVYEGPLYRVLLYEDWTVMDRVQVSTLGPHEVVKMLLPYWIPGNEPGEWLSWQEALALPLNCYTVEIQCSGAKKGLPLIGSACTSMIGSLMPDGRICRPMETMIQR